MRSVVTSLLLLWLVLPAASQQVVDRIVARIDSDIITLSEVRELGRFQQLVEGLSGDEEHLLAQLIDQWIVETEAKVARFGQPTEAEVRRELDRLEKRYPSSEAFRARLRELGLTLAAVKRLLERQLYFARYLDYKFRPATQVDTSLIEAYYRTDLVKQLQERGEPVPPLEKVQDQIRELLTQREISRLASRWLDEAKRRLKIARELGDRTP